MSQVFSADCVSFTTGTTLPQSTVFTAVTGNFLNPPFQNAKAMVIAVMQITPGASTTSVTGTIRRNPNAENLVIAGTGNVACTANNALMLVVNGADVIPDGRPVQYTVTVQQFAATGTGTLGNATINTILISG